MLELIEDSLGRLLDDASPATDTSSARPLIESLHEAGMLDVLAPDADGEMPLAWRDAARLFMQLGAEAPDAPVADAILARALVGASVDLLPVFTVLAIHPAALTLDLVDGSARLGGTLDGVPWGEEADAAVAVIGGGTGVGVSTSVGGNLGVGSAGGVGGAGGPGSKIVLVARSAASKVRPRGTGVEARAAWRFDAADPMAVIDCPQALQPLLLAAAARAAQIAGAMRAARELTVHYANERVQFGKPIGRQQAIQHRIAVMAEHSAMVGAAAMLAFAGDGPPASADRVATAKGLASEYAAEVAAAAHAVHGAIGFTDEYALARLTRRMWQWRSEYGGPATCYEAIGARVLSDPTEGVWPRVIETTRW